MTNPNLPHSYIDPTVDDNIDFKRYLSLFMSNWYWFAIGLFITVSISYGINRWSEKVYTVSSTILIKDDQYGGGLTGIEKIIPGGDIFKSRQNIKNEMGILRSYSLNYIVMQALPEFHVLYSEVGKRGIVESRMYKNCPLKVIYSSIYKQTTSRSIEILVKSDSTYNLTIDSKININREMKFGQRFMEAGFDFTIDLRDKQYFRFDNSLSNKYLISFIRPEDLANTYRNALGVAPIAEEASLITLTFSGNVKEQATDYLNKLMGEYLNQGLDYKNRTADSTIKFIDNQLDTISNSLKTAEEELEKFRILNQAMDISKEGLVIESKLEKILDENATIELQQEYYRYLLNYILTRNETGEIISPSTVGIANQSMLNLVNKLSELQIRKRDITFNLETSLPVIELLNREIENAKENLSENVKNSLLQIDMTLTDNLKRKSLIEGEMSKLPGKEREMITIQRKFDLNNTVYTYLMQKRAEAGIAKASNVPDNRIIDYALPGNAQQIKPKKQQNLSLAFVLGLFIPAIAILLIDFLNDKIIDKKDIEKLTKVPIIGYISHNDYKTEIPVNEKPGSTLAESFRSVRTALKYFIKGNEHAIISITSTISSEGKTFFSTNLAVSLASLGKKVLLVGLDLRKPRIHRIFNLDNSKGLSNYLIGDMKREDVIQETGISNLYYITSGPVPPNPAELLDSVTMREFLEMVKVNYDYIIIDTPPVAIVTDALILATYADMNIFVVRQRFSSRNTIRLIEELNVNESVKNIGIVINDINLSGYYGYGLRYGYSFGYGYTYGHNYYGQYVYGKYGYSDSGRGYYKDEA